MQSIPYTVNRDISQSKCKTMNNTGAIFLFILVAAVIAAALIFRRKKAVKETLKSLPVDLPTSWAVIIDRPDAPYIQSVVEVPESAIAQLVAGIQKQIDCTPAHWTIARNVKDYNIYFIDSHRTNMDGSPALLVRGIQTAGTVIGLPGENFSPVFIVLPHQQSAGWLFPEYLKASARNESEHIALLFNDLNLFYYYQGGADIHPFFPDSEGN